MYFGMEQDLNQGLRDSQLSLEYYAVPACQFHVVNDMERGKRSGHNLAGIAQWVEELSLLVGEAIAA